MSPLGLHRVLEPAGVLPQAAWRLDPRPEIWPDEVRVAVDRLNLDAASFRQLREASGGDPAAVRAAVLDIVGRRGKMHNPVTGSGGMLIGVVDAVGPQSALGLAAGRPHRHAGLAQPDPAGHHRRAGPLGQPSEQVPCAGHAILFGQSIAAVLPATCPPSWPWPCSTSAAPRPSPAACQRGPLRRSWPSWRRRQERVAVGGRRPPGRGQPRHRRRAARGRGRAAAPGGAGRPGRRRRRQRPGRRVRGRAGGRRPRGRHRGLRGRARLRGRRDPDAPRPAAR